MRERRKWEEPKMRILVSFLPKRALKILEKTKPMEKYTSAIKKAQKYFYFYWILVLIKMKILLL